MLLLNECVSVDVVECTYLLLLLQECARVEVVEAVECACSCRITPSHCTPNQARDGKEAIVLDM